MKKQKELKKEKEIMNQNIFRTATHDIKINGFYNLTYYNDLLQFNIMGCFFFLEISFNI
jgi:hypothetical protein